MLTLLLLRRGEVVPGAQLIKALWGEEPPGSAQTALHGHISNLRKLLGADRIRTRPPGYLLQVSPDEVDLTRFESLIAEAQARDEPAERSARLRAALSLWRGEPLADLRGEEFAEREIARLDELRLAALEDRIDADLALGRHHDLVRGAQASRRRERVPRASATVHQGQANSESGIAIPSLGVGKLAGRSQRPSSTTSGGIATAAKWDLEEGVRPADSPSEPRTVGRGD